MTGNNNAVSDLYEISFATYVMYWLLNVKNIGFADSANITIWLHIPIQKIKTVLNILITALDYDLGSPDLQQEQI